MKKGTYMTEISYLHEQLQKINNELLKMGAQIVNIEKISPDFQCPMAKFTVLFDREALDEYIAQYQ